MKKQDEDDEIYEIYQYTSLIKIKSDKYMNMVNKKIIPAYADRAEKLCKEIADKNDLDAMQEKYSKENQEAFLAEWEEAVDKEDYDEKAWLKKEKEYIRDLGKVVKAVEKARKDPSIADLVFNVSPKKLNRPGFEKVMTVDRAYYGYLKRRRQSLKKIAKHGSGLKK